MKNLVSMVMVDDDADDFFLMETILREEQLENPIHHVENGHQLLDFLQKNQEEVAVEQLRQRDSWNGESRHRLPGLILLDINMPGMNGLEVLSQIKGNPQLSIIPVVVFSTVSNPETVRNAYRLGANSFITKPSTVEGLTEVVRSVHKCFLEWPAVAS